MIRHAPTGLSHGEDCAEDQCADNMGCVEDTGGVVCTCVTGLIDKLDGTCGESGYLYLSIDIQISSNKERQTITTMPPRMQSIIKTHQ